MSTAAVAGATSAIIVYRSHAEMVMDQAMMSGEFFAIISGVVIGIIVYALCMCIGGPNRRMTPLEWSRQYRSGVKVTRTSLNKEHIYLTIALIAGCLWTVWMWSKL